MPVAIVATVLLVRHVAETRRHGHPLDPAGQALAAIALSLLDRRVFIAAGQRGWLAAQTLILVGAGAAGSIVFVLAERGAGHPMVDPLLFRRRAFSLSVRVGVIFNFCLYGGLFCLALDLHEGAASMPSRPAWRCCP